MCSTNSVGYCGHNTFSYTQSEWSPLNCIKKEREQREQGVHWWRERPYSFTSRLPSFITYVTLFQHHHLSIHIYLHTKPRSTENKAKFHILQYFYLAQISFSSLFLLTSFENNVPLRCSASHWSFPSVLSGGSSGWSKGVTNPVRTVCTCSYQS